MVLFFHFLFHFLYHYILVFFARLFFALCILIAHSKREAAECRLGDRSSSLERGTMVFSQPLVETINCTLLIIITSLCLMFCALPSAINKLNYSSRTSFSLIRTCVFSSKWLLDPNTFISPFAISCVFFLFSSMCSSDDIQRK